LPFARRLLVVPSAAVGMLLVAGICLGPERALRDFGAGFEQALNVPLAPGRVRAFFALLQAEGFWMAMGVLATKLAVFNLLPLPPMSGFLLLSEGINRLRGKKPSEASSLFLWGLLPTLALTASWIWGVYEGLR
jgi:membrane-associated protease RseP (regulator of RpoE activity)